MSPRRRRGDGSRWKKGAWSPEEDEVLRQHVAVHGAESWSVLQSNGLIDRPGKSCRLRWVNKLRPGLRQGKFSPSEERMVLDLQAKHGNKWALIASHLAGRTDNDVKNFWSTRQKRLARRLLLPPPQLLREPPRRKRSPGQRGRGSSSSALSLELCDPQEPSYAMITFQSTTYEVGQSSSQVQEPHEVKHCIDALLPGVIYLPAPPATTKEQGSSSMVPYGNYAENPVLYAGAGVPLLEDYDDLKIPCISRQEPSSSMITSQATKCEVGQSSSQVQEPRQAKQCMDAALPRVLCLPAPPAAAMEPGSSSMVPYGCYAQNHVPRARADDLALPHYNTLIPCISRQGPSSSTITFHSSAYEADQITSQEPYKENHNIDDDAPLPGVLCLLRPVSPSIAPSGANNNEDPLPRAGVGLAALHYADFVEPEAAVSTAPLSFGMNFRDAPAVEPRESVKPADPFFCLDDYYAFVPRRSTSGVRFDDLSPETLAFFNQHASVRMQNGRASG